MPPLPLLERSVSYTSEAATVGPEVVNDKLPNKVKTTRFTWITWIPMSLWQQFHRIANVYFLVISCLVCLEFSPVQPASTALPFAGVLLWTALKDMYEDRKRQRDDDHVNLSKTWKFDIPSKQFVLTCWRDLLVGDIILSFAGDMFPADLMLAGAQNGQAFISTMSLDGETNLKERRPPAICSALSGKATALSETRGIQLQVADSREMPEGMLVTLTQTATDFTNKLILEQKLHVAFDKPKVPLPEMGGRVKLLSPSEASKKIIEQLKVSEESPLTFENFLPRGCKLQQTAWAVSVIAYPCRESKVWLNSEVSAAKTSNLQVALNRCVLGLVAILFCFCLLASVLAQVVGTDGVPLDFPKKVAIYFIILYHIVPVSLYVVFELVKLLLGNAINRDEQMKDAHTGDHALARTSDLVEELGQVEHIFSDKTGTLTCNEMRFARCYIQNRDLGDFRPADGQEVTTALPPGVEEARRVMNDPSDPLCQDAQTFFMCLAVCHDAQVDLGTDNAPEYSGSSADEVAFLEAANQVGMSMRSRQAMAGSSGACLEIKMPTGKLMLTNVLCVLPFDSDRKRMTVVCEWDGNILCVTKGADTTMAPLCSNVPNHVVDQLKVYAKLGLRTLVIACKNVDSDFFAEWQQEYETARSAGGEERERLMVECAMKMEHSLRLYGLTAVEDRLQDGVPAAIATLNDMNIHVWMLTGDKTETAIEIAKSCNLIKEKQDLVKLVEATSNDTAWRMLQDAEREICSASDAGGKVLVLDGTFMLQVGRLVEEAEASSLSKSAFATLIQIAMAASSCVCCRLSPKQKRGLVDMVRTAGQGRITLAVGDGANDVAMIQGAHVGIAVRGREGTQAVQACDVAISQFRFLVPLLQCHGRRAYRSVSLYICYFIYKHVALAVGDMLWACQDSFRGSNAYPEWLSSGYPVVYTALPIIIIVLMDRDLPDDVAINNPTLYRDGQDRVYFNVTVFSIWMASGVWHGGLAWLLPSFVVDNGRLDGENDPDFWMASTVSFSLVMAHVSLRLWLVSLNRTKKATVGVLGLCLFVYFVSVVILGHTIFGEWMQPELEGVPLEAMKSTRALLVLFLTPLALILDLVAFQLLVKFRPTRLDTARKQYKIRARQVVPVLP
eukprot:TRINITY_DN4543_c0_g2_i1.p1 TRINITY_DN4543_c0_g2~~TRINITY_DN4543_c0_g2_i1.p1  ORF type:complete len:1125 (+),score=195.71 TRINITY_DN4543_c0_g2_i1:99-3473(+)